MLKFVIGYFWNVRVVANLAIISSWPILATGRKCSFERLPYLLLNYFLISQELELFSGEVSPNWWRSSESSSGNAVEAKWTERRRQKFWKCKVGLIWEFNHMCQHQMKCLQQKYLKYFDHGLCFNEEYSGIAVLLILEVNTRPKENSHML